MKTLIFLLCAFYAYAQDPDLVVEIFRHGIRSPEESDFDPDKFWEAIGYGELTGPGMRQQYILGAALLDTYPSLLGATYSPGAIYVQSAQENRTIVSAESQLYGIYNNTGPSLAANYNITLADPPFNSTNVNTVVTNLSNVSSAVPNKYSPIPVHSMPQQGDYLLQSYLNCPNANSFYYSHINDSVVQGVFAELNGTVQQLQGMGLTANTIQLFDDLGDTVMCDYANDVPLPGNIDPTSEIYRDLLFFTRWYEIYPTLALPVQRQIFAGPFLYNLLSMIQQVQNGTTSLNFVFYAAKETMLSTILTAFNIMTPDCLKANWDAERNNQTVPYPECIYPAFAANLIFEFYNTSDPYVRVKYGNNVMSVCGTETCSLADFTSLVNNVTNGTTLDNFKNYCGVNSTLIQYVDVPAKFGALDIALICVCAVLLVALIGVGWKARSLKKAYDDRYANFELKV